MLTSMARRPPTHVQHMNGLHHQPYQSKAIDDEDDDNEEERDARRVRSRILANKLSESLLHRSSSSAASSSIISKEDSIEQRIKTAIDVCDIETLKKIYCQAPSSISIERRFKSGGWTALIHAAYSCHFSLVSLFVSELAANVNSKSSEEMSPLMACCMSSHSKSATTNGNDEQLAICRLLLEQGAEIEPAGDAMTPLMLAARFGCSPPLIHLLVKYGANIDRCDAKGWCPLIMATQHGHLGSVEALVRSGANLKSTTSNGLTAIDIARHLKYESIVQFLLDEESKTSTPASLSSPCSDPSEDKLLSDDSSLQSSFDGLPSEEQSWKSVAYKGAAATVLGGALLFGLVYMRR